jgi:hypothetical protein
LDWQASVRYVATEAERPRWRVNLSRRLTPRLQAGLEWNPVVGEVMPTGTWVALTESDRWPMLTFGTSSDRIFSPEHTRAWYATAAKSVGSGISPYVGLSWSEWEDRFLVPLGCNVALAKSADGLVMHDGRNTHWLLTLKGRDVNATLILVKGRYWGLSLGWGW